MATLTAPKKRSSESMTASERLLNLDGEGVLQQGGKKFAVNLLWLAGDDPNSSFSTSTAVRKSRMQAIKPDFTCERSVIILQQGYGHLSKSHRMGMPVAAAMAADLLVGEWHGVFKADNGWWYIAVHGDAIAPDGDIFFISEEQAYQHFLAALDKQRWPRSYAPKEWSIAGTNQEIDLEKLLSAVPTIFLQPATLNSLFGDANNKFAFIVGFVALVTLLASIFITGIDAYMSYPERAQRFITQPNTTDTLIVPPKYVANDAFSNRLLEIDDFPPPVLIRACLTHFETMFRSLPGWTLDTLSCENGNVTGIWQRGTARLADLSDLRGRFGESAIMTYDGNDTLTVTQALRLDNIEKMKMQVLQREILYALLTKRFESKGAIEIKMVDASAIPAPPPIDPSRPAPAPPVPEKLISFNFKSPLAAHLWADDFDIPGLKPLLLRWQIPDSQWEISGVVKYQ